MNIVKLGGSIINPDGKYNQKTIEEFIQLVKGSKEKFIFVVGGGKLCRYLQNVSQEFLEQSLPKEKINYARDWIWIATTCINADYILTRFKEKLKEEVYPEILINPTNKIDNKARIYFTGGWKPGCSTDKDMMLLAKTFQAKKVFKITDFDFVKNIKPIELLNATNKEKILEQAENLKEITWQELQQLVGNKWIPGLNTPFDSEAVTIGLNLKTKLYIGKKEQFFEFIKNNKFQGTVVS